MKKKAFIAALFALTIASSAHAVCPIDITACGFATAGDAGEFINEQSDYALYKPHTIGLSSDGTFFAEAVVPGKRSGSMCYAVWYMTNGCYVCPTTAQHSAINGNKITSQRGVSE